MALVGNISGSGGTSNTVGITGSLIIANPGLGTFPGLGGNDVALFVSGNISAKPSTSPAYSIRGTTVFGGDVVISGTLFGGSPLFIGSPVIAPSGLSGSLQQTAGGLSYLVAGANVTITSASNGQVFIAASSGGAVGGSGTNFFYDTDGNAQVYTTGSVAFVGAGADYTNNIYSPADKGADLFFYVSGSTVPGESNSLFGGRLITSGNVVVKDGAGSTAVSLGTTGVVSGSGAFFVGGGLTIAGDIESDTTENKSVFATMGANTLTLGQSTSTVAVPGNFDTNGTANIAGNITLDGAGSQTITQTGTGGLAISSQNGQVTVEGTTFNGDNVTIPGDLTVRGTVVAIDTTNLRIKDPIVLIGSGSAAADSKSVIAFASGSSGGINSLVFGAAGVVGGNFLAAAQADVQDGSLPIGSLSLTNYVPIRASSFQLGGTLAVPLAFVSSSAGTDLILSGTTANLGSTVFNFQRAGSTFATFGGNGPGTGATLAGASGRFLTVGAINGTLNLSGSTVAANFSSAFQFQEDGVPVIEVTAPTTTTPSVAAAVSNATLTVGTSGASSSIVVSGSTAVLQTTSANGVYFKADAIDMLRVASPSANTVNIDAQTGFTTANVVNTVATTVNLAGEATVVEIGAATGTTSINNNLAVDGNTTLGNATTDTITFTARAASDFLPAADSTHDLGSPALRWKNMYTGDLHLRNDRGSWTIIEEEEYLSITNNLSGRRYKFVLQEI